ncbi:hypothetical protein IF1G_09532 [Cordyceps javanica]|uniref:Uncharacterized protein n=1 Tax=Cordyceps javanica TaxID=43265 RepID=A0A545UR52_9HYPO|nr:hypothetical protein IF1G_09532 [Cordyceps javanica]
MDDTMFIQFALGILDLAVNDTFTKAAGSRLTCPWLPARWRTQNPADPCLASTWSS